KKKTKKKIFCFLVIFFFLKIGNAKTRETHFCFFVSNRFNYDYLQTYHVIQVRDDKSVKQS
ncbi:hypothetical protein ACVWU4_001047, partial [Campylobacter coli]